MKFINLLLLGTFGGLGLALAVAFPKASSVFIPISTGFFGATIALTVVKVSGGDNDEDSEALAPPKRRALNPEPIAAELEYPDSIDMESPDSDALSAPAAPAAPAAPQRQAQSSVFAMLPATSSASTASSELALELRAGTVIFCGAQGSGKSVSAEKLLHYRAKKGAEIVVLNHHAPARRYRGLQVYGRGTTIADRFLSIEKGMRAIIEEIDRRYDIYQRQENATFSPLVLFMDEMTSWDSNLDKDLCRKFVKLCLTDTRKVNIQSLWVCHNLTVPNWGGVPGVSELIKSCGTLVYLNAVPNETGNNMVSSGYAIVVANNQKRKVRLDEFLPVIDTDLADFTIYQAPPKTAIQQLEAAYKISPDYEAPAEDVDISDMGVLTTEELKQVVLDLLKSALLDGVKSLPVRNFQRHKAFRAANMNADKLRELLQAMASENAITFDGNQAALPPA